MQLRTHEPVLRALVAVDAAILVVSGAQPASDSPLDPAKNRRRKWIWLGISLIVLAALAFEAKPLYRGLKSWRARHLAAAAEVEIAQERWPEGFAKVQAAYQLAPAEPEVLRTMARFHGLAGRPAVAAAFWQQLKALHRDEPEDRRRLAEEFLRMGAMGEAQGEIERLLKEQPEDARNLRLAARWSAAGRQWDQAISFARHAHEVEPTDLEGVLLWGAVRLEAVEPAVREDGAQALLKLGADPGKAGLQALEALGSKRDLPPATLAKTSTLLKQHPGALEGHRLLALDLDLRLRPAEADTLLDEAVSRYQTAEPAAQRAFGVWLNGRQEYARTLRVLPMEKAFLRKDLLLVHLDALAAQKRWPEIEAILSRKQVPLDAVYAELFLARASMEQGQVSATDLHWRRAHLAAAASPEQMMYLGNYAEKIGETHQAERAFRELISNASVARPAYEALLRLAEKKRDTAALRGLLGEMKGRWPNDSAVLNDYAYLSLLLDKDVAACRGIAAQLVAKTPASLPHRTTLALAAVRLNDPAAALAVYDGLEIPWAQVAAGPRAVYAAVLGLNGKDAEARAVAAALRLEDLRAEERELIKPWRSP